MVMQTFRNGIKSSTKLKRHFKRVSKRPEYKKNRVTVAGPVKLCKNKTFKLLLEATDLNYGYVPLSLTSSL